MRTLFKTSIMLLAVLLLCNCDRQPIEGGAYPWEFKGPKELDAKAQTHTYTPSVKDAKYDFGFIYYHVLDLNTGDETGGVANFVAESDTYETGWCSICKQDNNLVISFSGNDKQQDRNLYVLVEVADEISDEYVNVELTVTQYAYID